MIFPRWVRAPRSGAVLWIVLAMTPLLTAAMLRPSANGHGTHQQLGLPPCSSIVLLGIRCPACGMTTSWAHFMHGQWASSVSVNAGGFFLALLTVVTLGVATCVVKTNRSPSQRTLTYFAWATIAIATVTAFDWAVRLINQ